MKSHDELLALAHDAMRHAMTEGADAAEAFVRESRIVRVASHGNVVSPTESHAIGVGLRVIVENKVGVSASAGLHRMEAAAKAAVDSAKQGGVGDTAPSLPPHIRTSLPPTALPKSLADPDPDDLQDGVAALMAALDGPRITFRSASLSRGRSRFAVVSTEGVEAWDQGGRESVELEVRAEHGNTRVTGWDNRSRSQPQGLDVDLIPCAVRARERVSDAITSRPLEAPTQLAVLDVAPAAQILSRFARMLNGRLLQDGQSPLAKRVGTEVASPLMTIRDQPHGANTPQRRRVDDEGTPTQSLTLIDAGIATDAFHDHASAVSGGAPSNGHGIRRGWSGAVTPGLLMPEVSPGSASVEALIAEVDEGVYIEEPMTGIFTANIATGEFSAVLPFAYYIKSGAIDHALPNVTVSGNILNIVQQIEAVGRDIAETAVGFYAPIRAGGITCAT